MITQTDKHLDAVKAIQKKLLGKHLNYQEIYNLMDEITHERLGDILTTYFVASSFVEGFSPDELFYLTKAMVETGTKLHFDGIVADKHSMGGVAGTRATMIVAPIVAAAGFKIPKTSTRAITSPGGTADVMEVLANVTFAPHEIEDIVNKVGGCIAWGGKHLGIAPGDEIMIRIEEPLSFESFDKVIVSIMAKKIAVSTNHLILDIPVGPTMKIKHLKDAQKVAHKFKTLGEKFGMTVVADINETLEPAGYGIGPFLEARDVLSVLEQQMNRPRLLEERSIRLAGKLLDICFAKAGIHKHGEEEAKRILSHGLALRKFKEIVKAQGGDDQISTFTMKTPAHIQEIISYQSGTINHINNFNLNAIAKVLGAPADKYAGIYLHKKLGDYSNINEPLFSFHSTNKHKLNEAKITLQHLPIYEIHT